MSIPANKLLTVQVDNLRLRAYIGYLDWEKEKLQDLVISFSFKYDAFMATQHDSVEQAVNYKSLTKALIKLVDNQSFHLIETVAEKIYAFISRFSPAIQEIFVQVEKPHALRFADNVMVKMSSADRLHTALISLGSNIDPQANFAKALDYLRGVGYLLRRTEFISTKPLKFEDQADFLNGAILLHTALPLWRLELELKQIETLMGRVRTTNKNAARTIDLDVVTFDGILLDEKELEELPFLADFVQQLQPESMA